MEQQKKLGLTLEIVFWIATLVVVFGVLYPINSKVNAYPFLWKNILVIVVFVTYSRFVFLWKYTLFARSNILRILIMVSAIPLVFYLVQNLNGFQTYLDDNGNSAFMDLKKPLSDNEKTGLLQYIRSQFVFFSTAAIIAGVVLPIRMIISFWRTKNTKDV